MAGPYPLPAVLLFDLDGVLADVSRSYRRAILDTGATYGITISAEQVRAAKAAGHANNDWELTWRLLGAAGVEATQAAVTARFEALYQGTADAPGLRQSETLLVARAWLEQLAARLPLGLVTGRPRRDTERFLAQHGITGVFRTLVCMEDAPAKPDPAPVRLALRALEATTAWFIGDTPDDVRAALAAGVLPFGIAAPGDDVALAHATLREAGALCLLERVEELAGLLDAAAPPLKTAPL
ncbi:MAG: TIGR01548 family HAD-type hydrolase [Proteobacteria bacterium]|nr:TIGR01548 family HAD-type hydrolase [Pseudomonadota bacterium]